MMKTTTSSSCSRVSYYSIHVEFATFRIDSRYQNVKSQGDDSHGNHIVSAFDTLMNRMVAIKKVQNPLSQQTETLNRLLREIALSRHFASHENILSIFDIMTDPPDTPHFTDLYLVTNLFESDLDRIIKSKQKLSDHHHQFFIYQILRALKFIHSANVIHCNLNPSNLLVNSDCDLAIDGFGLARTVYQKSSSNIHHDPKNHFLLMTDSAATSSSSSSRYGYHAPEILLCDSEYASSSYRKPMDIWSCGCILAEIITQAPFFSMANDDADDHDCCDIAQKQFKCILNKIGHPPQEKLGLIKSKTALALIQQHQNHYHYNRQQQQEQNNIDKNSFKNSTPHFALSFPSNTSFLALDLVKRMLEFLPEDRITVNDALCHPYLKNFRELLSEPVCRSLFRFDYFKYPYLHLTPCTNYNVSDKNHEKCRHHLQQQQDQKQQLKKQRSHDANDKHEINKADNIPFTTSPVLSLPVPQPLDKKFGDFLAQAFMSSVFNKSSNVCNTNNIRNINSNGNNVSSSNRSSFSAVSSSSSSHSSSSRSIASNSPHEHSLYEYNSGKTSSLSCTPRSITAIANDMTHNSSSCHSSCRCEIDDMDEMMTITGRSEASGNNNSINKQFNQFNLDNNDNYNHDDDDDNNFILTKLDTHKLILQELIMYRPYVIELYPQIEAFITTSGNNSNSHKTNSSNSSSSKSYLSSSSTSSVKEDGRCLAPMTSLVSSNGSNISSSQMLPETRINDQPTVNNNNNNNNNNSNNNNANDKNANNNSKQNNNDHNNRTHNNDMGKSNNINSVSHSSSFSFAHLAEEAFKAILHVPSSSSSSSSSAKRMNDDPSDHNYYRVNDNSKNGYSIQVASSSSIGSDSCSGYDNQKMVSPLPEVNLNNVIGQSYNTPILTATTQKSLTNSSHLYPTVTTAVTTAVTTTSAVTALTDTPSAYDASQGSSTDNTRLYDCNFCSYSPPFTTTTTPATGTSAVSSADHLSSSSSFDDSDNNSNHSLNLDESMELALQLLLEPEWYNSVS